MRHLWLGKLTATTVLALFAALFWFGIIAPLYEAFHENVRVFEEQADLLSRWQQKLEERRAMPTGLTNGEIARHKQFYVVGPNDALLSAQLQSALRAILSKHRLALQSAQNLPARNKDELETIGVRLQAVGTLQALRTVLHDIEAHRPLLFVEQLTLQAPHLAVPGQLPPGGVARMTATLEVVAAKWAQKPPPPVNKGRK